MIRPYVPKPTPKRYQTCLDIENNPNTGREFLIGFAWEDHGERKYQDFTCWDEWFKWYVVKLTEFYNKRKADPDSDGLRTIWAHNGINFDWTSFAGYAVENKLIHKIKTIQAGSRIIGIEVELYTHIDLVKTVKLSLMDSYMLLPRNLNALSKTFKLGGKEELENLPHIVYRYDPERVREYLRKDVFDMQEILYEFQTMVENIVGPIGKLPRTLPSLAFKVFRMTLDRPIMTPWREKIKTMTREGYAGGRVSVFQPGKHHVKVYDVNSMYPYVMREYEYPLSYRTLRTTIFRADKLGVYEIEYEQPRDLIPVLYNKVEKRYTYTGRGIYYTPEIKKLLEVGGKIRVIQGYQFAETGKLFEGFVNQWWNVRKQAQDSGDEAMAYIAKILMNSVYGKFAQKEETEVITQLTREELFRMIKDKNQHVKAYPYAPIELHSYVEKTKAENTFVAVAGFVTSHARALLYSYMQRVTEQGGQLIYCDTDSIHCTGAELPTSSDLGGLKLEDTGLRIYNGKKLNRSATKITAKGIGRMLVEPNALRIQVFDRLDRGEVVPIKYLSFPTLREVLLEGMVPTRLIERTRRIRQVKDTSDAPDKAPKILDSARV